jgi:excinuclease ABC subunit C
MREVVGRRLARLKEAQEAGDTGEGFARMPDLILLDGGRGHVSAVRPLLAEYGLSIPLFGMVKDDKHRTRAIAKDGGEIQINSSRAAFTLVSDIQNEVHRFAISYHNSVAGKHSMSSQLLGVPGIGQTRAKELMRHFKTVAKLKSATEAELCEVKGMNSGAAHALYEYFRNGGEV